MPGHLVLFLHAHLPYVRHPEQEDFLEEEWLHEAISECYLPLVDVFERLAEDGVPYRVTFSVSPTLLAMLSDPLLVRRWERRQERLLSLAEREVARTTSDAELRPLALYYREHLRLQLRRFVDHHRRDLPGALGRLAGAGGLELVTCGATHAFLPLWRSVPSTVRAQVAVAVETHERAFGARPRGIWLPECGYYPGVERVLAEHELRYTLLETHGLTEASPPAWLGPYQPVFTEEGVAAFARDPESSREVWSAEMGFPGHPLYRDYYRDIGLELEPEALRPFLPPGADRRRTGLKYHRVTDHAGSPKAAWDPDAAFEQARRHAVEFVRRREARVRALGTLPGGREAVIVAPYDAELFGHWWYEGPTFLETVARTVAASSRLTLSTPSDYLARWPEHQVVSPAEGSWGEGGFSEVWLNPTNEWAWREVLQVARELVEELDLGGVGTVEGSAAVEGASSERHETLREACRQLMLAQASDWAFILNAGTQVGYAQQRLRGHLDRLRGLLRSVQGSAPRASPSEGEAGGLDATGLFPGLDPALFMSRE